MKFSRIKRGHDAGDYVADVAGIKFTIFRCIGPVRFALSARRNGESLTDDIGLRWGTFRAAKERAERILETHGGA